MSLTDDPQTFPGDVPDPLARNLGRLSECVKGTLAANDRAACCAGIYPGVEIPWDHCGGDDCGNIGCSGMAYVQVRRIYPSESFPDETVLEHMRCNHMLVAELAVGVVRCVPVMDANGRLPRMEDLEASAQGLIYDSQLLRQAMLCCWLQDRPRPELDTDEISLGAWTMAGPQGGCVGGEWLVRLVVGSCPCTEEVPLDGPLPSEGC